MTKADLFTWREEADAAAQVVAAEAARAAAEQKARFAPKGTKQQREAHLRAATIASLLACAELAKVRQRDRP